MKTYTIEAKIKVNLLGNGTDYSNMNFNIYAKNTSNAILELTKELTLDDIKFLRRNTIKYDFENNWSKAFSFEIKEILNVKLAK